MPADESATRAWATGLWKAVVPCTYRQTFMSRKDNFPVRVPCQGDAFSFRVTIDAAWIRRGTSGELERAISVHASTLYAKIERRLRNISRCFRPDDPGEFELAAAAEFRRPEEFPDDPTLTCDISFRAAPDELLLGMLREATTKRVQADTDRAEEERQARHTNRMRQCWLALLKEAEKDRLGYLSVQIAGNPDEVAGLMAKYVADQEQTISELRDLCDTASKAYQEKAIFDFDADMNGPLHRLLRYLEDAPQPRANGAATANGAGQAP